MTLSDNEQMHVFGLEMELQTSQRLARFLTRRGLMHVRAWLRHPDTVETAALRPGVSHHRALVLHEVCQRLVDVYEMPAAYFVAVRDLLPTETPEDASSLTPDTPDGVA